MRHRPSTPPNPDLRRYVRTMAVAGLLAAVPYLMVLGNLGTDPYRTAVHGGTFSNFYDIQARSFLHGHLAVPDGSLSIEGFELRGHSYMYFPPGPALLRVPLLALTDHFDGKLSALSMLAAWVLTSVLVALTIWRVRRMMRGSEPLGRAEAAGYGALLVAVSAGSVVLFLASMPWVYHEAYAWAIAFAMGAVYGLLGVIERPSTGRVLTTAAFTTGAILCRTTAGWACVGGLLITAGLFALGRGGDEGRRHWWKLLLAGAVPLAIGVGFNWAKFHHPYFFPLEHQAWTHLSAHRRDALAANGGDLVAPNIFPTTAINYFRPDGIRFIGLFPFITLPAKVAQSYGGGYLDQTYRTGSVPAFMPLLFASSIWGIVTAFRPRSPEGARSARVPLLVGLAIPGGIMFYGYLAYRYTSEFVVVLVLAGAIGMVDLARRLAGRPRPARLGALAAISLLAVFGVAANTAAAFTTERMANPGPSLVEYIRAQEAASRWSGHRIGGYISFSDALTERGRADEIRIVGDCQGVYLGHGEPLAPWVPVEARNLSFEVELLPDERGPGDRPPPGVTPLVDFESLHSTTTLALERSSGGRHRFTIVDERGHRIPASAWRFLEPGSVLSVDVVPQLEDGIFTVRVPEIGVLPIPSTSVDRDHEFFVSPNVPELAGTDTTRLREAGYAVRSRPTPVPPLCERLRDDAQGS
ncbi:MAG: hypothetical protein ACJ739_08530 [Acidimicrobiales bacterium]